ncbi:MAG: DHHA1 domain-containing protein [Candidatus Woesearchaeota archaeon]
MKTFILVSSDDRNDYNRLIEESVKAHTILSKEKKILLVSHLDADGLSSCAITSILLDRIGVMHDYIAVQSVDNNIHGIIRGYDTVIFVDIGSGQMNIIREIHDKDIIILDHHEPDDYHDYDNIVHINPYRIKASSPHSISGAGVSYLFALSYGNHHDLAFIAIIGAIGDVQEDKGFNGLNAIILEDAINNNNIIVEEGLKLFGSQTKTLVRLLAYNNDIRLKNTTGSPRNAALFLQDNDINPYDHKGRERKYYELDTEEKERLYDAIRNNREYGIGVPDIEGYNYIITGEKEGTLFRDAREYATFLNACGRMDNSSIGVGVIKNDSISRKKALLIMREYKQELGIAINWLKEQLMTKTNIISGKGYIIIDARGIIKHSLIGTISSIASRMSEIEDNTIIIGISLLDENNLKASLRRKGNGNSDLNSIIGKIALESNSKSGGHENASGAIIPKENYDAFIDSTIRIIQENEYRA